MADSFKDLGIAPELITAAGELGWDRPTALQGDAVPVLRRGNNAVLHASTGSGVTGAWGLALLDRLASLEDDDAAPLALVLAPSSDEASGTASILARLGTPAGITARALAPGWESRATKILVATPAAALAAVRDSALKLDAVSIVVVSGADRMHALGDWDAVRTLTETATSVGQKILVTGSFEGPIEEYMDRHVRKALTIPPRPDGDPQQAGGSLRYALATGDRKVDALVALLPGIPAGEVAIVCRTTEGAARIAAGLAARGVPIEGVPVAGPVDESARRVLVLPAAEADRRSTRATVLSADPPFDSDTLAELHGTGGTVLAEPIELPHLRRIAARAGLRLQAAPLPEPGADDSAETARNAVRRAIEEVDLAAYLSLIGPLLEEHPAPEVAAAALYLARTAGGIRPRAESPSAGPAAAAAARAAGTGAPAPSTPFVRLFITVGERDDVTPGDLVGAITGETGVAGETVGRIDIRESHSTVEVASADADAVIRALNGRTLKGRSLRVDYDRKDRAAGPGGGAKGGPRTGGPRAGGRPGGAKPGGPRSGGSKPGGPRSGGSRPGSRPGGSRSGGPGGSRPPGPRKGGGSRPDRGGKG